MRVREVAWPELPSIRVPEPAEVKGPWNQEANGARFKRQHRDMLDAASRLLGEHGYAATSVAEIVAAASVSKRTFYEHFETRDDCFVELLRRVSVLIARTLIRTAEELADAPPADMFRAMMDAEIAYISTGPHLAEALGGVGRSGASPRLSLEENATQVLIGRIYGAAARRLGSTLPHDQIEMTGRVLSYGLSTEMWITSPEQIDTAAFAAVWCQAFGLG